MGKEPLSITETVKPLGINKEVVSKKIKSRQDRTKRVGRDFVVQKKGLSETLGTVLTESDKFLIKRAVEKVAEEYGETLKLFGKE